MTCIMCRVEEVIKRAMEDIDKLPEIDAEREAAICSAYQALEDALYISGHACADWQVSETMEAVK